MPVGRGETGDPEFGKSLQSCVHTWGNLGVWVGGTMKVYFHREEHPHKPVGSTEGGEGVPA